MNYQTTSIPKEDDFPDLDFESLSFEDQKNKVISLLKSDDSVNVELAIQLNQNLRFLNGEQMVNAQNEELKNRIWRAYCFLKSNVESIRDSGYYSSDKNTNLDAGKTVLQYLLTKDFSGGVCIKLKNHFLNSISFADKGLKIDFAPMDLRISDHLNKVIWDFDSLNFCLTTLGGIFNLPLTSKSESANSDLPF